MGYEKNINNYQILTPDGYRTFDGIRKLKKECIKIFFYNNENIEVSLDHIFIKDGQEIISNSLKIDDWLTENYKIKKIKNIGIRDVFDIVNVEDNNIYYTNNIISHNCNFIGSSQTVIDSKVLDFLTSKKEIDPILYDLNGKLRVYEKPINGMSYILGVDTALGTGGDFSTIQILKINSTTPVSIKQVGVYESNTINTYLFSEIVNRLSYYYNNGYIMVENNSEGNTIITQLHWEFENENLVSSGGKISNLGIRATTGTKPKAVLLMKKLIEDGSLELLDNNTIKQLTDFTDQGNQKFSCLNMNDDLISSLYWGCYFFTMDILEESITLKKVNEDDEDDAWGILSDLDIETENWDWI